jgi:hypothetical protein
MPKPVFDLGPPEKLWLRSEIDRWASEQESRGRTRPKRRVSR